MFVRCRGSGGPARVAEEVGQVAQAGLGQPRVVGDDRGQGRGQVRRDRDVIEAGHAAWTALPAGVTCTGATTAEGRRLRFVHNWSFEPARLTVPVDCQDALTGKSLPAGGDLDLGAWDVRILIENGQQAARIGRSS